MRYFPGLDARQREQLERLEHSFREWNARMNLVSRKDMDAFEVHHLLHSLSLAKIAPFARGTRILDVGTGGGLPGLPLAILFPEAKFFLCDSIAKKVNAVRDMASTVGLRNVEAVNKRAETLESKWDFILGRAVTSLPRFLGWIRHNIRRGGSDAFPNGVLYYKGSRYVEELAALGLKPFAVYAIEELLPGEPYFAEKYIVHLKAADVASVPQARIDAALSED